jgi:hypothetical protein
MPKGATSTDGSSQNVFVEPRAITSTLVMIEGMAGPRSVRALGNAPASVASRPMDRASVYSRLHFSSGVA